MPPQRSRSGFNDSKSESSNIREKYTGTNSAGNTKARRNGSSMLPGSTLKDVTNVQSTNGQQGSTDATATVRELLGTAYIQSHC